MTTGFPRPVHSLSALVVYTDRHLRRYSPVVESTRLSTLCEGVRSH